MELYKKIIDGHINRRVGIKIKMYFRNNTDYPERVEFTKTSLKRFLGKYHRGEPGDRYWYDIADKDGHNYSFEDGKLIHREDCAECLS